MKIGIVLFAIMVARALHADSSELMHLGTALIKFRSLPQMDCKYRADETVEHFQWADCTSRDHSFVSAQHLFYRGKVIGIQVTYVGGKDDRRLLSSIRHRLSSATASRPTFVASHADAATGFPTEIYKNEKLGGSLRHRANYSSSGLGNTSAIEAFLYSRAEAQLYQEMLARSNATEHYQQREKQ